MYQMNLKNNQIIFKIANLVLMKIAWNKTKEKQKENCQSMAPSKWWTTPLSMTLLIKHKKYYQSKLYSHIRIKVKLNIWDRKPKRANRILSIKIRECIQTLGLKCKNREISRWRKKIAPGCLVQPQLLSRWIKVGS